MQIVHREHSATKDHLTATLYAHQGTSYWRASIKRGYYDGACDLVASRWDGDQWRVVYQPLTRNGYKIMQHKPTSNMANLSPAWHEDAYTDARTMLGIAFTLIGE